MVSLWLLVPFTQAELEMGILLEGCRGYLQGDGTSGFGERRTIVSRAGPLPILSLPFCPPFFALHILSFLLLPVLSFMFLWVHGTFSGTSSQPEMAAWSPVSHTQPTEDFCGPETAWLQRGQK